VQVNDHFYVFECSVAAFILFTVIVVFYWFIILYEIGLTL